MIQNDSFVRVGVYIGRMVLAASLLVALTARSGSARDLWVDRDSRGGACSDARDADSVTMSAPLCTLGAAANRVAPGDTVHVRGGTYTEAHRCLVCNDTAVLQLITAGTADQWIRFVAEPNEIVTLRGGAGGVLTGLQIRPVGATIPSFNEVSGFHIESMSQYCVTVNDVPDVRLINLEATGCGNGAVELHRAQRVTLEGSRIHDNETTGWTSAIDLYLCKDGNVIRGNSVWSNSDTPSGHADSEGHGITMDMCDAAGGALIENNILWNNEGWCISIYHADGATIRNNTCYQNGLRPGAGEISVLGNRAAVHNNILVPRPGNIALNLRSSSSSYDVDTSTIQENHDLIGALPNDVVMRWADSFGTVSQYQTNNPNGWGSATRAADPLFASALNGDFHLAANSPARDTGSNEHAASIDADGRPRPYGTTVDRGAYEYAPPLTPTPPASPTNVAVGGPTAPRLTWNEDATSSVDGYAVTVDGVRVDYGLTPRDANGTCNCSIALPFSGGRHTIVVSAYNSAWESQSAPLLVAPTADAGGPYTGQVGAAVVVDGGRSAAPTGTIAGYEWNWGDGTGTAVTSSPAESHTYVSAGTFTIRLNVTDNAGAVATATTTATIAQVSIDPPSPPSIASVTPTSGPAGTVVTILGANFGATQATSTVSFNGIPAIPTGWSATSIETPVPIGATTGAVVVTVGGHASNGIDFTVTTVAPPPAGKIGSWGPFLAGVSPDNLVTGMPNGVFVGSPSMTGDGGGAFTSDAEDYLRIADGGMGGAYDWTAGAWSVQLDFAFPSAPVFPGGGPILLASKGSFAKGTGWEIEITNTLFNGKYSIVFVSNHGIDSYHIVTSYQVTPGAFNRALFICDDGGTGTWYVNGSPWGSQACTPSSSAATDLLIGRYSDAPDFAASFPISRVQIWNRALTAAEATLSTTTDPTPPQ